IYAVLQCKPQLCHLSPLLVSFYTGALETWERFTFEFLAGGAIDTATTEQIESAWMESTNDLNEDAFGNWQQAACIQPNMSLNYFNTLQMYKKNGASSYLKSLTSEEHKALWKLVCDQDISG
ncbi:hypothetical protein ARMGADRAFT_879844, partial [Armillaria gallica]